MAENATDLEMLVDSTGVGEAYGITPGGFVPKTLARLLDEKLAAARALFGDDADLTSGSALRKLCELVAVGEQGVWQHLGHLYDDSFVGRARGEALSALGAELGIQRPLHRATGNLRLDLAVDLPPDVPVLELPRGTRMTTPGAHPVFLDERVVIDNSRRGASVAVRAFEPGTDGNLDPQREVDGAFPQRVDRFLEIDGRSAEVRRADASAGEPVLAITHEHPLTGGETAWSDEAYRDLLLAYPRNLWSADALRTRVALVPGVRQVIIKDRYGGLDIDQAIYGNFNFIERLFSEERSLGSPYYVTVLVAPDEGAVWDGPGQLRERVLEAVDAVRPIGIYPNVAPATEVGVSFSASVTVHGVPVAPGEAGAPSADAQALRARILDRARRYVDHLRIGEPVRWSEIMWTIMEEPGVVDCKQLRLQRYPPTVAGADPGAADPAQVFGCEQDVAIGASEVASLVERPELVALR